MKKLFSILKYCLVGEFVLLVKYCLVYCLVGEYCVISMVVLCDYCILKVLCDY